jgi:hypothetical protein
MEAHYIFRWAKTSDTNPSYLMFDFDLAVKQPEKPFFKFQPFRLFFKCFLLTAKKPFSKVRKTAILTFINKTSLASQRKKWLACKQLSWQHWKFQTHNH